MKLFARLRRPKKARGNTLFRYGWKVTLLLLLAGAAFAVFLFYGTWAQSFDMKNVGEMPERSTVYDVDGKIYSRLAGANRLKVSLNEVSPLFIAAVLAREDARFYEHKGIDWRGILRALVRDILSGSAKEGASSITQQLARNSLPLGGRTMSRKLLEAMVALRIERQFTKQQILELYLNRIYFGNGCYGVETASQSYFGKNAAQLNLPEAALLAGLIRGPNRFSPLKNPEGAAEQRVELRCSVRHEIVDAPAGTIVELMVQEAHEVGGPLFISLLIITASFLPVFALQDQEGRLFKPLAWTKTLSMASAAILSMPTLAHTFHTPAAAHGNHDGNRDANRHHERHGGHDGGHHGLRFDGECDWHQQGL